VKTVLIDHCQMRQFNNTSAFFTPALHPEPRPSDIIDMVLYHVA
jgi:hypothetical protein